MGSSRVRGEPGGVAGPGLGVPAAASRSFAEFVAALNRLNALEAALATAIARAPVPVQEVRALLRAQTTDEAANAAAFQFLREVFSQVGIPLTLAAVRRFSWTFAVDASPYARLVGGDAPRRTCGFVSESLARFLASDLGLPAQVEEVACRNEGAPGCRFTADFDTDAVRAKVLDPDDWALLRVLPGQGTPESLGMSREEWDYRMERLVGYGLVAADGRVLPEGERVLAAEPPRTRDDFAPPWEDVRRLTGAIADAQSAAEALVTVAPREAPRDVAVDAETAALAADCRSFAELLARASKGRIPG